MMHHVSLKINVEECVISFSGPVGFIESKCGMSLVLIPKDVDGIQNFSCSKLSVMPSCSANLLRYFFSCSFLSRKNLACVWCLRNMTSHTNNSSFPMECKAAIGISLSFVFGWIKVRPHYPRMDNLSKSCSLLEVRPRSIIYETLSPFWWDFCIGEKDVNTMSSHENVWFRIE